MAVDITKETTHIFQFHFDHKVDSDQNLPEHDKLLIYKNNYSIKLASMMLSKLKIGCC